MIKSTPRPPSRPKVEQLTQFLAAPTPDSLLEPGPGRSCDGHQVSATCQADDSFVLFARAPTESPGKKDAPMGDLTAFLNAMIEEVQEARGGAVADAAQAFHHAIERWNHSGQAPTVTELRALNGRLSALPPLDFRLRNRARYRVANFLPDLKEQLGALHRNDPRRDALSAAGNLLADMLFTPGVALSLEGLSGDTIGLLLTTGLLAEFADLRDGVKPPLECVVLPASAQHLLDHLRTLFPTIRSWAVL